MFLLLAPVDAAAQHVVHAALDETPDHPCAFEVPLVTRSGVEVAEVDAQPDIIVVEAVRSGSRMDVGGVGRGHAHRIEVLGQSGQHPLIDYRTVRGVGFENGARGRQRAREGPQIGIGIRTGLILRGQVTGLVIGVERVVLTQQTVFGDPVADVDRVERHLRALQFTGRILRGRTVAGCQQAGCRSSQK